MSICEDAEALLSLSFLPGLGAVRIRRLVDGLGSAAAVLREPARAAALAHLGPRCGAVLSDQVSLDWATRRAVRELQQIQKNNLTLLSYRCAAYPQALANVDDKPALLYVRGNKDVLSQPGLALVGSRSATDYGRRVARQLAAMLSGRGFVIVSGAAYGIDAAAHEGALEAGGATIAVLGCGVDVVYPPRHGQLLHKIIHKGAIISEYPLGTPPEGFRFPARNRIISGLSQAVVVVEAAEKSGSLITARCALEQGREVLAVPGRIDSCQSVGAHRLIQQGAGVVQSAEDILEALGWRSQSGYAASEVAPKPENQQLALNTEELEILRLLHAQSFDIDALARQSGHSLTSLQALLLSLELQGLVVQLPGRRYECSTAGKDL